MKITPEAIAAWQELKDSFEQLQSVMNASNAAMMADQLTKAKVVASDAELLIERLRRARL